MTMSSTTTTPSSSTAASSTRTTNPTAQKQDADYIPPHLRQYVFHSQDDFYVSRFFDPLLLAHLMYEGFLPIASEFQNQCFLLPKLHRKRCILLLDSPEHVPKSVKKRSKKYKLVLNQDFDGVVKGCHEQHGIPWLYPPIVEGFRALYAVGARGIEIFPRRIVRFYSVELLDVETNALAAGELGYTIGKVYTSLTGFSRVNGAGTVQLHALGKLLYLSGMKVWDLGMSMPYKMSLGASDVDRDDFLAHLYTWRTSDCMLEMKEKEGDLLVGVHAKALFDLTRSPRKSAPVTASADRSRTTGTTLYGYHTVDDAAADSDEGDYDQNEEEEEAEQQSEEDQSDSSTS